MARAPPLALAALAIACLALAGCASTRCMPEVEVRNCGAEEHCAASLGERTLDWNAEAGELWPPVARLVNDTAPGATGTASWTPEQERSFWLFWNVPAEEPNKHLFFRHEGATYRVQDVPCP